MATPKQNLEYAALRLLMAVLGTLPRGAAHRLSAMLGSFALLALPRLRSAGLRNLEIAFPDTPQEKRDRILRDSMRNLGRQLGEFCHMPRYTRASIAAIARCEGEEHFLSAQARGKGTLVLTGHVGAWELSSFYHSLLGHPMAMVIRRLDNPKVDRLVNRDRKSVV